MTNGIRLSPPSGSSRLSLDEQLCFSLYSASMAVGRAYKPLLDALGITYPQYLVLSTLWERDGESIGAIAERLSLEPSTVTPLVTRLAAAGLVFRTRSPQDDRKVLVRLTSAGRALEARTGCLAEELVAATGWPLDELRRVAVEVRALREAVVSGSLPKA